MMMHIQVLLLLLPFIVVDSFAKTGDDTNVFGMGKHGKGGTEDVDEDESGSKGMKGMGARPVKGETTESKMTGSMAAVKANQVKEKQKGKMDGEKKDKLTLRVMSYNIWGGGANEGKPVNETVNIILAADADIIGVQETRLESDPCTAESCPAVGDSVVGAIADALGFYYYDQTAANVALWANGVISRFPIMNATKNDLGVMIDVDGEIVYAYNLHFTDYPYQPCKCSICYF